MCCSFLRDSQGLQANCTPPSLISGTSQVSTNLTQSRYEQVSCASGLLAKPLTEAQLLQDKREHPVLHEGYKTQSMGQACRDLRWTYAVI